MNKTLKKVELLKNEFDLGNIRNSLNIALDLIDSLLNLFNIIKNENDELQVKANKEYSKEFSIGYNKESKKIFCGPIEENGSLAPNSQDRTLEILTTLVHLLKDSESPLVLNNSDNIPIFELSLKEL